MIFKLRLMSEDFAIEFQSTFSDLRLQLSQAFREFKQERPNAGAVLEVYHAVHGWNRVCLGHQYPIINNPFNLNFIMLRRGIRDTLAQCDTWPTEEQKAQHKMELLANERDELAQQRRKAFSVVSSPSE